MHYHKFTQQQFRLMYITQGKSAESTKHEILRVLKGGCQWIQIRMKDASMQTVEEVACWALPYCLEYNAILIVNDYPAVALFSNAHGVHLGKNDPSPYEVRKILGDSKIIGSTANCIDDITLALSGHPDYFGIGPFRFTTTKKNLSPSLDKIGYINIIEQLKKNNITTPWAAIGGIALQDLAELQKIGISNVAVSGAIANATNAENATHAFLDVLHRQKLPELT